MKFNMKNVKKSIVDNFFTVFIFVGIYEKRFRSTALMTLLCKSHLKDKT